ncbi:hypothetical protein Tco_0195656 [Tanacetum coccineum]
MKEFRALVMVSNLKDKEYFVPGMTDGGWYGSSLGAECKEGYDEGGAYEGCFGGKWVGAADVGQLRPSCGSFATKNIVIAGGNNVLCNKDMMILTLTFFDGFALTYYEDKTGHRLDFEMKDDEGDEGVPVGPVCGFSIGIYYPPVIVQLVLSQQRKMPSLISCLDGAKFYGMVGYGMIHEDGDNDAIGGNDDDKLETIGYETGLPL